ASDINEEMKLAAAKAIAGCVSEDKLTAEFILPNSFDRSVPIAVAEAVAEAARKSGEARI
ncbi:MAG: NAD-dependent malic enzyme, partial [Oscillospiraceae bacterium]|nr:NAD-dependent malic enzyme [Oscillospiraceae bacterium]